MVSKLPIIFKRTRTEHAFSGTRFDEEKEEETVGELAILPGYCDHGVDWNYAYNHDHAYQQPHHSSHQYPGAQMYTQPKYRSGFEATLDEDKYYFLR